MRARRMLLGEEFAASHGAMRIGLSVFGFNTGAKALYDSLGYTTTSIKMAKELSPGERVTGMMWRHAPSHRHRPCRIRVQGSSCSRT